MHAIEFETKIENGMIHIPKEYLELENSSVRIIMMKEEPRQSIQNKETLSSLLSEIKKRNIFKDIDDPVAWQRKIRDEWNERNS
ncbi:MAG: hypothetical protein KGZ58_10000 [Ignavibacteriales bacterium]|nr:hypothetical protein [Ignavibacteriales bacterium]